MISVGFRKKCKNDYSGLTYSQIRNTTTNTRELTSQMYALHRKRCGLLEHLTYAIFLEWSYTKEKKTLAQEVRQKSDISEHRSKG